MWRAGAAPHRATSEAALLAWAAGLGAPGRSSIPSTSTPRSRPRWPSPSPCASLLDAARRRGGGRAAALLASRPAVAAREDDPGRGRAGAWSRSGACAAARAAGLPRRRRPLMAAGFLAYYHAIFGVASPLAIYGGVPTGRRRLAPARARRPRCSTARSACCPYAPVFLLAPGRRWAVLVAPARAWEPLLVGAAVIAPVLPWRMWWGGQCPPARFLVPLVPVLALALAARVGGSRARARALALAAGCFSASRPRSA